jgi:hypothetical protein
MINKQTIVGTILGMAIAVAVLMKYPSIINNQTVIADAKALAYKECIAAMQWSESELANIPHMSVETTFDGIPQWQHIAPGQVAHIIVEQGRYMGMRVISTTGEDLGMEYATNAVSSTKQ